MLGQHPDGQMTAKLEEEIGKRPCGCGAFDRLRLFLSRNNVIRDLNIMRWQHCSLTFSLSGWKYNIGRNGWSTDRRHLTALSDCSDVQGRDDFGTAKIEHNLSEALGLQGLLPASSSHMLSSG